MTSMLRASALGTLAATFLAFGATRQGTVPDGRGDWADYAWQQIAIADCTPQGATLHCPPFHEKWDWKRDQWVDITVVLDLANGALQLTQRLTNADPHDDDYVCVTALAVDAIGADIIAHHQNWQMAAGADKQQSFRYPSVALASVATLHIGSKQCRDGGTEDDALYARVLAGIHS